MNKTDRQKLTPLSADWCHDVRDRAKRRQTVESADVLHLLDAYEALDRESRHLRFELRRLESICDDEGLDYS